MTKQWELDLVEDCKDIAVEFSFTSRWALIEGYHSLGTRILEEKDKGKTMEELVQLVGQGIDRKRSSVFYAVQFAQKFPDLDLLPEGKNTLWRDMVHKYLPAPKDKIIKAEKTTQCPKCGFEYIISRHNRPSTGDVNQPAGPRAEGTRTRQSGLRDGDKRRI